jgi:hypothetical protein
VKREREREREREKKKRRKIRCGKKFKGGKIIIGKTQSV